MDTAVAEGVDRHQSAASTRRQPRSVRRAGVRKTSADVPYVTWRESDGTNNEVRVARLNGSTWKQPWTGVSTT